MKAELDSLESAMLEQTYRFGLGLPELGLLIEKLRNANVTADDLLDSPSAKGYLGQALLYGHRRYYFLAEGAHRDFELDESDLGPLSKREKAHRYAMLRLCLESKPIHRPLTRTDFQHHFPTLLDASPHDRRKSPGQHPRFRSYYLAGRRLGLLRVDLGGIGRYDRILGTAYRQIQKHRVMRHYAELITQGAFELSIVTAFPSKAQRLRADLASRKTAAPITIHAVPEICQFIAPTEIP